MATLHLMVGLPCSGKTTLARRLEQEFCALRLTPDEWHIRLFGQDVEDTDHDARHDLVEKLMWDVAARALALGVDVILDFGFWARSERDDFRLRAKQLDAGFKIHFLDVPAGELLARLRERNISAPQGTFMISEEMLQGWVMLFEPPSADELEQ